jgi:hypothetical protein
MVNGRKIFYMVLLFLLLYNALYSQLWQREFGESKTCWAQDLKECYDNGYYLLSQVDPGSNEPRMHAWLIKTDINGNQIWDKKLFDPAYRISCYKIGKTTDQGLIMAGSTTRLDSNNYDPFFIKLNSCGEKEWCKIFSTPGNSDYGVKIIQISGGYIALLKYFQDWHQKRIWLFKLDESGNIIWQKLYAQNNPKINNEEEVDLMVTSDNGYLITGDCYYYDSISTYWLLRPLIIKTDPDGNEQWQLIYGLNSGYRGDVPNSPHQTSASFYYCSARHFRDSIPFGDSPSFLKIDSAGNEIYYRDLIDSTKLGMSNTLNFINDSVILIAGGWSYHTNISDSNGIIKTDTLGNILKTKILLANVVNTFQAAIVTHDEKYLVTGGFSVNGALPHIYLYKLNFNLDFDTLYNTPFIYDSLCPHMIVSDTSDLDDCSVITAIREPEEYEKESRLLVYPNPASNQITVEFPKCLIRKSFGHGMHSTTIYHQWINTRLDVLDLSGRLIVSGDVAKDESCVVISTSSWPDGMYLVRLIFMNEVVSEAKLVIKNP